MLPNSRTNPIDAVLFLLRNKSFFVVRPCLLSAHRQDLVIIVKWASMCRHLGGEACNLVGIAIRQPSQARCTLAAILIRALPLDLCLFATWLSEELPKKGKP